MEIMALESESKPNSFKKLEEEQQRLHPEPPPEVERNVMGNARNIKFMGNVIELYFSRVMSVLAQIFGANPDRNLKGGEYDEDVNDAPMGNAKNDNQIQ